LHRVQGSTAGCFVLCGDVGANDVFGQGEDLLEGEGGGVDEGSVGGGAERGVGAIAVASVAILELAEDGLLGLKVGGSDGDGGDGVLLKAAVSADFRSGVKEDFDFRVGEDFGADVAAFHDDTAGLAEGSLLRDHPCAEMRVNGYAGGCGGDIGLADAAADVHLVEQDAVAVAIGLEGNSGLVGEGEERSFVVEVEIVLDGFEGERTVHGTGFEIEETEAPGEVGGEGGLTGTGRTIDSDDGPIASGGRSGRCGGGVARIGWRYRGRGGHEEYYASPPSGLGLRPGGRLPQGLLPPLNLSKVLTPGASGPRRPAGFPENDFFLPAKLPEAALKGFLPA